MALSLNAGILFDACAASEPTPVSDVRVNELQNLRFGMFICWSFSTFSGKEWTPGVTNLALFHPTGCDTDQWVKTAKEAGMGYILFLTKHHDGFCLWDTQTTDRKVTKSSLGRDVLAELKKSCDKHGIKLALYFSEGEWRQPGGLDDPATPAPKKSNQGGANAELKKAQLKELLTGYGPIEYIWFDHAVGDGGLSHADTLAFCKSLQPDCFIGFNHGDQTAADIRLGEMGRPGPLNDHAAAGPHMKDAPSRSYRLAEFTYPILPKHQGGANWFYSLPNHDQLCLPAERIYADYLGAVKYGNVFALDVGPDYAGKLRDIDVQTLRKVGQYIRGELQPPAMPSAAAPASDTLKARPEAVESWKDMRFGMFICWGPVSLTGKEIGWSRGNPTPIDKYDDLYKQWNPEKFNAREWVNIAKDTGARYIVFLLKHHDGFCLWDTKQTDYNIMNGPFKRDVTRELVAACREQGIGFFPYYSTCDWHHPDFPVTSPGGKVKRPTSNIDRYTEYLEAQTKELITKYGPLVGIWFDVPQSFDKARGERVIRHVRSLQPDLLVNNRTGAPGDFDTPEQTVGRCQFNRPWESCITLGTQWTWKPNDTIKPHTDAVRILVACAVGDGNLALNTNPMPDGQMEPRQVENFRKLGAWLKQHGESIYGTRGGPFVAPGAGAVKAHGGSFALPGGEWWGGSTHKGNVIYLHILRWPDDTIILPAIPRKMVKTTVLTGGEAMVKQTEAGIEVTMPAAQRDSTDTIVKLEFDGAVTGVVLRPSSPISQGKPARASSAWKSQPGFSAPAAFDGDPQTRWGAAENSRAGWLEVDLGEATRVGRAVIDEGNWNRVREFELQAQQDGAWKTIAAGKTLGPAKEISFAPVTARVFRLNILKADDVPTICEFELFKPQ